jgi:hypothetical protein
MSCPAAASGPSVIDTGSAYFAHYDAPGLGRYPFNSYKNAIEAGRVLEEAQITPETSAALAGFSWVEQEIRRLLELEEADEFGPFRPTDESVELARKILFRLVQAGFEVPLMRDAGTDHDGALRLEWEHGPKFLELVVPRENQAYFYYSQGDQYSLQRDLTLGAVRDRFKWLST